MSEQRRLNYISFLQFIGPILVIIGHAMNGLEYNSILNPIKEWIYIFHMPLFFFISGYLFGYKDGLKSKGYKTFMKEKFWRLMFPYLVLNIIFIIPKFLGSAFIKDQVEFSLQYIIYIFLMPRANIWGHLWFLFALFVVYAISPIFDFARNNKNKIYWLILITFCVIIFICRPIHTDLFAINDLQKDLLFFVTGMIMTYIPVEKIKNNLTKSKFMLLVIIDIILTIICGKYKENQIIQLLIAENTIFILFCMPIIFNITNKFIMKQANYSFAIYIMHWPVILVTRIIFYQILNLNSLLAFIIMLISGYLVPNIIIYWVNKIKNKYQINSSKIIYYLIGI